MRTIKSDLWTTFKELVAACKVKLHKKWHVEGLPMLKAAGHNSGRLSLVIMTGYFAPGKVGTAQRALLKSLGKVEFITAQGCPFNLPGKSDLVRDTYQNETLPLLPIVK